MGNSMKKQRIRLTLRSYDHQLLDKAVKQIVSTVKRTGSQLMGPVPMPNKKRVLLYCVHRILTRSQESNLN